MVMHSSDKMLLLLLLLPLAEDDKDAATRCSHDWTRL